MELLVIFRVLLVGSITLIVLTSVNSQRNERFRRPSARSRNGAKGNNRNYQIIFDAREYEPLLPIPTFPTSTNKKVALPRVAVRTTTPPRINTSNVPRPIAREDAQSSPRPTLKPTKKVPEQTVSTPTAKVPKKPAIPTTTPATKSVSSVVPDNKIVSNNVINETQAEESIFGGHYYVALNRMKYLNATRHRRI